MLSVRENELCDSNECFQNVLEWNTVAGKENIISEVMCIHSKAALCGNTVLSSAICHRILYHCVPIFMQKKMVVPMFLSEIYLT